MSGCNIQPTELRKQYKMFHVKHLVFVELESGKVACG
jgi:hypothetical protein